MTVAQLSNVEISSFQSFWTRTNNNYHIGSFGGGFEDLATISYFGNRKLLTNSYVFDFDRGIKAVFMI